MLSQGQTYRYKVKFGRERKDEIGLPAGVWVACNKCTGAEVQGIQLRATPIKATINMKQTLPTDEVHLAQLHLGQYCNDRKWLPDIS